MEGDNDYRPALDSRPSTLDSADRPQGPARDLAELKQLVIDAWPSIRRAIQSIDQAGQAHAEAAAGVAELVGRWNAITQRVESLLGIGK